MNEIMNITEVVTMTSLEIVNLINKFREEEGNTTKKEHKDFMKSIRNEIETLKGVGIKAEGNFSLGSYIDKNNPTKEDGQKWKKLLEENAKYHKTLHFDNDNVKN